MKRSELREVLAGVADLRDRKNLRPYGFGPLNGQERRREIVRAIAATVTFDRVVETGTYRATSTAYLAESLNARMLTIECDARMHAYSRCRLALRPHIETKRGDSIAVLRELAVRSEMLKETVFFYLDAHWYEHQPLSDELTVIAPAWTHCVVMVDDFAVPDDEGYGYASYGPSSTLTEACLPADVLAGWSLFYPAARSENETGARRGCCVLAPPQIRLDIPELRHARAF